MRKSIAGLVLFAFTASFAAPAWADKKSDALIAEFKKLDKNNDSKLSKEEFTSGTETIGKGKKMMTPEQQFKNLDKDNDGYISATEFAAKGAKKK